MAIRLWPNEYERKEHISKAEKVILRNAERNFKSGHIVVGIDPVGLSNSDNRMGLYISPNEGLVTYSIQNYRVDLSCISQYIQYINMVEDKIYERLLDSKMLISRNGDYKVLKFPYKHILMFPFEKVGSVIASEMQLNQLLHYVTIGFFRPITSKGKEKYVSELKIFDGIRKPYDKSFERITELECRAIFERLAPEYTVIINEIENVKVAEATIIRKEKNLLITGKELEYKTFFLDEYQVAQVNDMGKGHRVILANPGAGKSVLLLSKSFKYSSVFKEAKVLLTCYNSNLADAYNFKRACADFGENNNLFIMTFHKLVKRIYLECLNISCASSIATEEEIERCIDLVKQGKVNLKFKAIFIDEVQIFNPLYLELCYLLLDKTDPDHVFLMAGDLNQTIKALSRRGDAPWKNIKGVNLDFTGRVRYIEKNYRNSKDIAEYIANMLALMNKRLSMLGLINFMEYEYNSFKIGQNQTIALKVTTGVNRMNIKDEVANAVKEIVSNYKISYSDIAILFPYKKHSTLNYFFLYWIQQALDDLGITYSLITSSDDNPNARKSYSQTTGVVLSTIESSLGLDFKAVIFAGLYPYNYIFNESGKKKEISSWAIIRSMKEDEQAQVQSQMRAIYTACSRARDILYVLSDIKPGSPMEEILKK